MRHDLSRRDEHVHTPVMHGNGKPVVFSIQRVSQPNDKDVCAHMHLCAVCGVLYAPPAELKEWNKKPR